MVRVHLLREGREKYMNIRRVTHSNARSEKDTMEVKMLTSIVLYRGPLLFSLLLSLLLSRGVEDDQKAAVFSGVFAMVWVGGAVVTLQIKLLGGNM